MDLDQIEVYATEEKAKGMIAEEVLLYSAEERTTFANLINYFFKDDQDNNNLTPINARDNSLFLALENGILLCKLLKKIHPAALDDRAINL